MRTLSEPNRVNMIRLLRRTGGPVCEINRFFVKAITKIRVGKHLVGIMGLKDALADIAADRTYMSDDQIGKILLKRLSKENYIDKKSSDLYENAFLREYKKSIGEPVKEEAGLGVDIKVLGQGCSQCESLTSQVMAVIAETGIPAMVEHVKDIAEIAQFGFLQVPALVINGQVKAAGVLPPKAKIKTWIQQAASQK